MRLIRQLCDIRRQVLVLLIMVICHTLQAQERRVDRLPLSDRIDTLRCILSRSDTNYVLVAGHRGGDWRNFPENSIPGLLSAIKMGVDIVEMDVRKTKDNKLVVIHDLTLDRTTTGHGRVVDWTLDSLQKLYLKDGLGSATKEHIPTLEDYLSVARGKIIVYLDKSIDKVPEVLTVLIRTGSVKQSLFVLPYTYQQACSLFGEMLDKVIYVPILDDSTEHIASYVDAYHKHLSPLIFQLRIPDERSQVYPYLRSLKDQQVKMFIAATWHDHSLGHDDEASLVDPEKGWGWLISNGVSVLETNRPQSLLKFLQGKKLHD